MNDELFYELTTKFLSHELTEQERDDLTILLQIESYKHKFEKIVDNWNNDSWNGEGFDIKSGIDKLTGILRSKDPDFYWGENINKKKRLVFNPLFLKAAAVIAFIILISTILLLKSGLFNKPQPEIQWIVKANQAGEKSQITLLDGSSIVLNASSRIKYPSRFEKNKREIYLEGEAYFVIAHDSSKPFIVHSADIYTTVLGTRFNISSFNEEGDITVALAEGKVKISEKNEKSEFDPVVLKPNEKMVYDKERKTGIVKICDIQQETGWKDNILKFKSESLSNVIIKLEREYGVKFEFPDKSYSKQKITTNFQNASIWSISEVLKKLTGLKYKTIKENNEIKKIVFYKPIKK